MRMRRVAAVAALALLGSCSFVTGKLTTPEKEPAVKAKDSYLPGGGVRTELELGRDQKLLMTEFVEMQNAKINLETRVEELDSQLENVRASLGRAEEDAAKERRLRAGAEENNDRMQKLVRDRETKILSLQLERNKLQQELLRTRVAVLQSQLEDAEKQAGEASAPAPRGDGK